MENLMTNTQYQKENILNVSTIKYYTWNKSWVRPFESPLSAYINFCSINALTTNQILKLWGCKQSSGVNHYDNQMNCYVRIADDAIDKIKTIILPDDYYYFPAIYGAINYISTFRYCPECLKQGYHSLSSQIPTEHKCPIHKINYIDSNRVISIGERG